MDQFIICVDDEKIVTDTLLTQLTTSFGDEFEIEAASSVDEALELIEELIEDDCEIKLIISDWLMPYKKGDQLLLKVHEQFPEIPLVMLSGQVDPEAIENLETSIPNNFKFVRKPWDRENFINLIKSYLFV